jgi:hypothetical protein
LSQRTNGTVGILRDPLADGIFREEGTSRAPMIALPIAASVADPPRSDPQTTEGRRMRPRLRLFKGEDFGTAIAEPPVNVRLGDVCQILADATLTKRGWMKDFEDDEIGISADLYEVLSTYWHLRPSA